jgi:hypothetical protein
MSPADQAHVTPDTEIPALHLIQETQEPQMTQRAMSLMDVLAPPGNDWLRELSRRKSDLPVGVHIVRFSDADDEAIEDSEAGRGKSRRREKLTA